MKTSKKEQMETPQKEQMLQKELKDVKFDFTQFELDYILKNANFTEEQEQIFKMITDRTGRKTVVCISMTLHISESTVNRRIKKIKKKILKLL